MKPKSPLPWKAWPLGDITGPDNQCVTDVYPPHPDDADYIVHACNAYPKLVELEAEKDEEIAWLRERVGLLDSLLGECLRHHYYDDARVSQSWLVESHKAVTSTGRALNQAALAPGGLTARKGK